MKPAPAQTGFTLLELMIALTVLGVLLVVASPGLGRLVDGTRLSGSSRDFVVDFSLARNEAAMRGRRVTVCSSANGATCATTTWNTGRLVYIDDNGAGTVGVVDAGEVILSTTPALNPSIVTTPFGAATAYFLSFEPRGRLAAPGQIRVCIPGHERRVVNLHRSGTATLDRETTIC